MLLQGGKTIFRAGKMLSQGVKIIFRAEKTLPQDGKTIFRARKTLPQVESWGVFTELCLAYDYKNFNRELSPAFQFG